MDNKTWRARNPDYDKNYYHKNKEKLLAYQKQWLETHKEFGKKKSRKRILKKYGLSLEEYSQMLIKQNGVCKICLKPQYPIGSALCVDHNHKTGRVRGLLCYSCNAGLGKFQDNIEYLLKASYYLEDVNGLT
jgi:hypothetical protein